MVEVDKYSSILIKDVDQSRSLGFVTYLIIVEHFPYKTNVLSSPATVLSLKGSKYRRISSRLLHISSP